MQANLNNPDFNPLLTPAEAASDPSTWGENKPNRLRVWQEHRYAYDSWGNCIEKKSGPNQVRHFAWDAEHRLSRATLRKSNGRFVHVEHWGYDYDPFGRRIAKYRLDPTKPERCRPWLDGGTTHFSWDGNRLLLERQGERQSLYVYEPDSFVPLALVRSEGDAEVADQDFPMPAEWLALKERHPADWEATAGALIHKIEAKRQARRERQGYVAEAQKESAQGTAEILYFHTDHLGTPRELTDASGHIVWSATYKAWGNTAKIEHPGRFVHQVVGNTRVERWQEQSDPVEQNLRFQGQYFDLETGLHYNRFRYYDPDIGRFVSQDPIGLAGGINNYQYAPNPIEWTDPLGLNRDKNHSTDKKPNIANRRCDCRKWNIDNSDRVCEGHVSGVGRAKFYRNPETGEWWSADQTGHGGSAWKVFTEERGSLTWKADANEFGDFIEGKHKGPTGRSISLKDLKCLNQR